MEKTKYGKLGKKLIAGILVMAVVLTTVLTNNVTGMAANTSITLSSQKETIAVGKSVQLKVKAVKGIKNKSVTWKSSNSNIAKVSSKGKVTGIKEGSTKITATSKSNKKVKATCKITVKKDAVQSIELNKTACVIVKDKDARVKLTNVYPSTASSNVTWKINKSSIAKVTVKGNTATIKGKKAGKATLIATATDGSKKTAKVDVVVVNKKSDVKKINEIKVSLAEKEIFVGESTRAKAVISPTNATLKKISWSSNNENVAEIDQTGKIIALKAGIVKVTASAQDGSGKKASVMLRVKEKAQPEITQTPTTVPTTEPEITEVPTPKLTQALPTHPQMTEIPTAVPGITEIPTSAPELTQALPTHPQITEVPTAVPGITEIPTSTPELTQALPTHPQITEVPTAVPTTEPKVTKIPTEEWCESLETAGKVVREEMKKRAQVIELRYKTNEDITDGGFLNQIVEEALKHTGVPTEGDYLKWQIAEWTATVERKTEKETNYLTINYKMSYYSNQEQEMEVDARIATIMANLNMGEGEDFQKVKAIYDYICSNVTYDYENLNNESYQLKYTAYAALINGNAVCQGYANLLYRMLLETGIDCRIITGISNGEAHAWNIVKLNDVYYYLDSTWDARRENYSYFLKGATDFDNHISNEEYTTEEFQKLYPMAKQTPIPIPTMTPPAVNDSILYSGSYEQTIWVIDKEGCLTITGQGDMYPLLRAEDNAILGEAPWYEYRKEIKSAVVNVTGATHTEFMFEYCSNLETLDFSNFDTSQVVRMDGMFFECNALKNFSGHGLDTSNVTRMDWMFWNCNSLETAELSEFDTSHVVEMDGMFQGCSKLKTVDVSNFNTSNVTRMEDMFEYCRILEEVDVSKFDTSQVTNMSQMFGGCVNLKKVDVSGFDTGKVTNMSCMFRDCHTLTNIDVSKFDTSQVTAMDYMFWECRSLEDLNVSHFDTSQVTNMRLMFCYCVNLKNIDVSNFDTKKLIDMEDMFAYCCNLESLDVSGFDTSNVTSMHGVFAECNKLETIDVSNFDTSNVTNMEAMFHNCYSLKELNVVGFDTKNVTSMNCMFCCCSSLDKLDVSNFDTAQVRDMSWMFACCSGLETIDVSGFCTEQATDMSKMFYNCNSLKSLDMGKFDTSNVADMTNMFEGCFTLQEIDLTTFDTSKVTDMYGMFDYCPCLEKIITPHRSGSNTTSILRENCSWKDEENNCYEALPVNAEKSVTLKLFSDEEISTSQLLENIVF